MSGNALISANILLDGPIHNEQDLRAHTDEIVTVLSDALEDLRPWTVHPRVAQDHINHPVSFVQ
ncbi:hypothetical protein [Actinoplanes sp. NBRC 103695]|uniref:hypothetical protein n=1 Tax=Actinoplanes sp. NBRC 103695 TaxID=3032202 RepID=UPI0025547F76|nr:hypothetical protein [Actinoplanes sp. NBRC 103695]